jgi:hypothetical protein
MMSALAFVALCAGPEEAFREFRDLVANARTLRVQVASRCLWRGRPLIHSSATLLLGEGNKLNYSLKVTTPGEASREVHYRAVSDGVHLRMDGEWKDVPRLIDVSPDLGAHHRLAVAYQGVPGWTPSGGTFNGGFCSAYLGPVGGGDGFVASKFRISKEPDGLSYVLKPEPTKARVYEVTLRRDPTSRKPLERILRAADSPDFEVVETYTAFEVDVPIAAGAFELKP